MMMMVNETNKTVTLITQADLVDTRRRLGSADLMLANDGIYSSYGNGALGTPRLQ